MKLTQFTLIMLCAGLWFTSCQNQDKTNATVKKSDTINTTSPTQMKSHIAIFEIPATEISRAITFYQNILGIKIEKLSFPEMEMGVFPYEQQIVNGVLIQAKDYQPSSQGVTIYLNCGNDLQPALDKVESNGGKILTPKTPHADESGFFALILDSEGNKIGLHSSN